MKSARFNKFLQANINVIIPVILTVLVIVVGGSAEYLAEYKQPGANIYKLNDAFWWAVITITTVGYGDYTPVTPLGRSSTKGNENKSFKELSECAKGYDLGKVAVNAWVDDKPIAQVKAEDLKTTSLINASEVSTKGFNVTSPENSNLAVDYPGTHLGAAHGWYIFLKPLPVGEHTVRYVNDVRETTLGAGNTNNADITYTFNVK